MKTLACFLVTWITATLLLLWLTNHDTHLYLGNADITFSAHPSFSSEFWHSLWVAALYSLVNTFIVRFWQMQVELRKKS